MRVAQGLKTLVCRAAKVTFLGLCGLQSRGHGQPTPLWAPQGGPPRRRFSIPLMLQAMVCVSIACIKHLCKGNTHLVSANWITLLGLKPGNFSFHPASRAHVDSGAGEALRGPNHGFILNHYRGCFPQGVTTTRAILRHKIKRVMLVTTYGMCNRRAGGIMCAGIVTSQPTSSSLAQLLGFFDAIGQNGRRRVVRLLEAFNDCRTLYPATGTLQAVFFEALY